MKRRPLACLAALLACLLLCLSIRAVPAAQAAQDLARVEFVNDGDTLTVMYNGKRELVRLIGVDAPEAGYSRGLKRRAKARGRDPQNEAALGLSCRQKVERLVKRGDEVRLAWDHDRRDRYGRLLAYVYLSDGRMLNEVLISQGWARAFRKFSYKYKSRFLQMERAAQKAKAGFWSEPGGP